MQIGLTRYSYLILHPMIITATNAKFVIQTKVAIRDFMGNIYIRYI